MPYEWLWVLVVVLDEASDSAFQFIGGAVYSTAELLFCEQSKPAFNKVEPTRRGGRKVQVEARSFRQPVANQLCFVCAVVVQDQVDIQF